ncbi:hypothetical protein PPYR_00096 [Photinus pyralis]|uniref:Ig-like domain-containing protein n=1 Tax=Photinus pyralis TaxID=7054 RepID=A0A5N4B0N4_PHOPY|nr:hypothetical protein PPYR_00096 [Photinus pyralis]
MAFEYATRNNVKNNFNKLMKTAGRDWLEGFLKRNGLSIRKAEGTSMNRATVFNKQEVDHFYKLLGELIEKYHFLPKNIYNADESGFTTVQEPGKVLAAKGQRRVGSITSWERGRNITALCAMSATGGFIPPMMIYPRLRHSPALEKDGPVGALYKCSKNGWITEELFVSWLSHFCEHSKPSENEKVLLILDNHSSHISLAGYEYCKKNNIVMLSIPPHSSHRIQPLDVSFFGPMKASYRQECNYFMKSNLGQKITPAEVASLFRKAFVKVASISKAEAGFKATGIFPYNPQVFDETDFLPHAALNESELVIENDEPGPTSSFTEPVHRTPEKSAITTSEQPFVFGLEVASTSSCINPSTSNNSDVVDNKVLSRKGATVQDLLPIPTKVQKTTRKGREKQHAKILTSTPFKKDPTEKENKKIMKARSKAKSQNEKSKSTKHPAPKFKRKILHTKNDSSSESEADVDPKVLCDDDENDDMENDDTKCVICDDYGRDREMWYRCTVCAYWAHADCSGWDAPDGYICDLCQKYK